MSKKRERPLSPHISIYKPQITSILSILHRLTGGYLYIGMLVLVWWMVLNMYSFFEGASGVLNYFMASAVGKIMLFGWSVALFYHLLNGIRHLFWDVGKGYELRMVTLSGVMVLVGTIVLTLSSWAYIIIMYNE